MKQACNSRDFASRCAIIPQSSLALELPRVLSVLLRDNCSQVKRYLTAFAILLVLPGINTCSAQVADSAKIVNSLTKCWRAFSHEYSTIYGLEEEEIKRYSKQKICFTRDSVSMYLGTLAGPKYSIKKVNAEDYAKSNFDCGKRKLGMLTDSVFEITISSISKPGKDGNVHKMTDVIAFDGESIYVVVDGVIFKMFDADSKVRPSAAN